MVRVHASIWERKNVSIGRPLKYTLKYLGTAMGTARRDIRSYCFLAWLNFLAWLENLPQQYLCYLVSNITVDRSYVTTHFLAWLEIRP